MSHLGLPVGCVSHIVLSRLRDAVLAYPDVNQEELARILWATARETALVLPEATVQDHRSRLDLAMVTYVEIQRSKHR